MNSQIGFFVDVPPMTNLMDDDQSLFTKRLIDNAVVPIPQLEQACQISMQRLRRNFFQVFSQPLDSTQDVSSDRRVHLFQLAGRGFEDARSVHATPDPGAALQSPASRLVRPLRQRASGGAEQMRHRKPYLYQVADEERQTIAGGFVVTGQREARFWVGDYDATQRLIIDPVFDYSTLVGGSAADDNASLVVDRFGNAYVIAEVFSRDFPTTSGVLQPVHRNDTEADNANDIGIFKLNAIGSDLVFSTFIGGSAEDVTRCKGSAIAIDDDGNVYVSGETESGDFPAVLLHFIARQKQPKLGVFKENEI